MVSHFAGMRMVLDIMTNTVGLIYTAIRLDNIVQIFSNYPVKMFFK